MVSGILERGHWLAPCSSDHNERRGGMSCSCRGAIENRIDRIFLSAILVRRFWEILDFRRRIDSDDVFRWSNPALEMGK